MDFPVKFWVETKAELGLSEIIIQIRSSNFSKNMTCFGVRFSLRFVLFIFDIWKIAIHIFQNILERKTSSIQEFPPIREKCSS